MEIKKETVKEVRKYSVFNMEFNEKEFELLERILTDPANYYSDEELGDRSLRRAMLNSINTLQASV